jgi:hypothetical protein
MSASWLAAVGLPAMLASFAGYGKAPPKPVLVMPFAVSDAADEFGGEDAAREDHMDLMLRELRTTIDQRGVYRTIAPDPLLPVFVRGDTACVLQRARDLGAAYVLAGAVRHIDATASNVWLGLFDAADGKRLSYWQSTFRGDNEESWRRAACFLGEEISAVPPPH